MATVTATAEVLSGRLNTCRQRMNNEFWTHFHDGGLEEIDGAFGVFGTLTMSYRSTGLLLDSGDPVSPAAVAEASESYGMPFRSAIHAVNKGPNEPYS
jgi:hypothetical protein